MKVNCVKSSKPKNIFTTFPSLTIIIPVELCRINCWTLIIVFRNAYNRIGKRINSLIFVREVLLTERVVGQRSYVLK